MGFVYFSSKAYTPDIRGKYSCLSSELAYATPENKRALQNYISNITTSGNTRYKNALEKAFSLLKKSIAPTDRDQRGEYRSANFQNSIEITKTIFSSLVAIS